MTNERETISSGKLWIIIGIAIATIALLFTIAMGVVFNQNIDRLTSQCEKSGGVPIVKEEKFLGITTSYEVKCDN